MTPGGGANKVRITKIASNLVLPAAPPSQFHDGTGVADGLMLDAAIAYPPPSKSRYVLESGLFSNATCFWNNSAQQTRHVDLEVVRTSS